MTRTSNSGAGKEPNRTPAKSPNKLSAMLVEGENGGMVNGEGYPQKVLGSASQGIPLSFREDVSGIPTPTDNYAVSKAVKVVLLYTIVDALDLTEEEEIWLNWSLGEVFETLSRKKITNMPLSARQELFKSNYTELLKSRRETFNPARSNASLYTSSVTNANVADWVENVMSVIQGSYVLSAREALGIEAKFVYIFTSLGVGNASNPRGAAYIPADLKQRIFQKLLD